MPDSHTSDSAMTCPSRRQWLALAAAGAASLAATRLVGAQPGGGGRPRAEPPELPDVERAQRPINILILGGTGFIGPHQVQHARARGHKVTIANRGQTRPEIFEGMEIDHIEYDREQDPAALRAAVAEGRTWDLVIDNVSYVPAHTKAACEALGDAAGHYAFISSTAAYATRAEGATEQSPLAEMDAELAERATMQEVGRWYGALKVKCEKTAERLLPGRVSRVRPGYIVGWGDPTDRFTYWPARVMLEERCGGKMLVPGTEENPAPIQVIDVRDLAAFLVTIGESQRIGTYNLVGPTETLPKVLEAARAHTGAKTEFVHVPFDFLAEQRVRLGAETPIIVPPESEFAGFAKTQNDAAVAAGLKPRPIEETTRATIDWWKTLPAERRARIESERSSAMKPDREQELLEKWAAQQHS